ncbi:MAG: hypothetical protein HY678_10080, partial [Chloroflexi bacterium]|nr:hypothetical protein [Chloroflexota bacterium]
PRRPARGRGDLEREQGEGGRDRREITKLPKPVVEYAHGQMVQMLHELSDDQIDTLVAQLKLIKNLERGSHTAC